MMVPSLVAIVATFATSVHYTTAQSTLSTVLSSRGDLDSFNELLDASGFSSTLFRSVGFDGTVFAPNDDAFQDFSTSLFSSLLDSEWADHAICFAAYHTVEGTFLANNLTDGATLPTIDGDTLMVSGANPTKINGANIVEEDIIASNGVSHILDAVLMPDCVTTDMYQLLNSTDDYSVIADLIAKADLVDMISTTAPITLFAPKNQAWQNMGERFIESLSDPENLVFLRAFLMNHVISGNWYESRLDSDESFTLQTTLGTTAFFYNNTMTHNITNSEIIGTDWLASNGVIHDVSPVVILAAVADILLNAQLVTDSISFSNFTAVLMQANFFDALFLDSLNAPRTTTVFAPTDEAFAMFSNETITKLLDPAWSFHLRELLRYHLVDGTINGEELGMLETVTTLTNFNLTVTAGLNLLMVNNATIVYPDLVAYNGIIHGINQVLIPTALTLTILDQLEADPQFSTFLSFLQVSDNISQVLKGVGPMTLFIPTNSAFELFDSTVDSSSFSPDDIEMILEYHVDLSNVLLNELENNTSIETMNGQNVTMSARTIEDSGSEEDVLFINDAEVLDGGLASNGVVYVLSKVLLPELPTQIPTLSPAPTIEGYIAPSNAPSSKPVMSRWPQMPSTATDSPPTSSATLALWHLSVSIVGCSAIFVAVLEWV
jgi:transforming growth factor-beta-induced protein